MTSISGPGMGTVPPAAVDATPPPEPLTCLPAYPLPACVPQTTRRRLSFGTGRLILAPAGPRGTLAGPLQSTPVLRKRAHMRDNSQSRRNRALGLLLVGAATLASVGCGDETDPLLVEGTIAVGNSSTGTDLDANGYLVSVNGGQGRALPLTDTLYLAGMEPGNHEVSLSGIAPNCSVPSGTNPQQAEVQAGDTTVVMFNITCTPIGGGGGGGNIRGNR